MVFDGTAFTEGRMDALAERLVTILDAWMASGSRARLGDVALLTDAEERQVLSLWPAPVALENKEALLPYQVCTAPPCLARAQFQRLRAISHNPCMLARPTFQVVERYTELRSSAPAVIHLQDRISWAELEAQSNQLANFLLLGCVEPRWQPWYSLCQHAV